jgi:general secretion pathway protein E/type IV pilus assembly protein PilB
MNNVDLRISTHPIAHGENIVIRILNKEKSLISIENLGFWPEQISHLKVVSNFSDGMIIFCGPTGSGKTTSIYSLIEVMDKNSRNIMTLEDPIEYKIQDVRQTEIKDGVLGFADGIRSILRQDPDVILIGEIRDEETAKMAIRASMTGHLVLTTIHSNNSFGVITRLRELGISPYLIASNIITIVSQRLVKKIGGGRYVISEILNFDQKFRDMISKCESEQELQEYAYAHLGFKSIVDDMESKLRLGIISEDATIRPP